MLFEGSEKKVEVVVTDGVPPLRQMGDQFWSEVVAAAEAKILSKISSSHCDAYLLSESSLFVWNGRFTLITCGTTTLASAIHKFFAKVKPEQVTSLIFERKNEYFPHKQSTSFHDDVASLEAQVAGTALRFGYANEHHLHLYHMNRCYQPATDDTTLELLMYDPQGPARAALSKANQSGATIREVLDLRSHLGDFEVDDHVFEPCGYSVNALRGNDYYTIHVTPQGDTSFVSFETNIRCSDEYQNITEAVLSLFQPRTFDIVHFRSKGLDRALAFDNYELKNRVSENLECGYHVEFSHYYQPLIEPNRAQRVNQEIEHES